MNCVCCNKKVIPMDTNEGLNHEDYVFKTEERRSGNTIHQIRAEDRNWDGGLVANISAGWGSRLDCDNFVIAICDDCVRIRVEGGVIVYLGNSLYTNHPEINEKMEKNKKAWRRNNNLDELI